MKIFHGTYNIFVQRSPIGGGSSPHHPPIYEFTYSNPPNSGSATRGMLDFSKCVSISNSQLLFVKCPRCIKTIAHTKTLKNGSIKAALKYYIKRVLNDVYGENDENRERERDDKNYFFFYSLSKKNRILFYTECQNRASCANCGNYTSFHRLHTFGGIFFIFLSFR